MPSNNPHIFYTDDDIDDREAFRDALAEVDSTLILTSASNGESLLEALNAPPPVPRVIFLDLNMPGLNGFEVLRAIRANKESYHYPVIIFTTADDEKTAAALRSLGANMFVTKPRSYDGLKKAIAECINRDWTAGGDEGSYFLRAN